MDKELITTFKKYKESYDNGLENHNAVYEDYDELHFINSELEFYQICYETANVTEQRLIVNNKDYTEYEYRYINEFEYNDINQIDSNINENYDIKNLIKDDSKFLSDGYNLEICKQLTTSFTKIISFLETKKSGIGTNSHPIMKVENTLNWQGSELEFAELVKALIMSKKLNPEFLQNKIFERMKLFFNVKDFSESDKLKEIRNRTNTPTPLINVLEISLTIWIENKVSIK